MEDWLAIPHDRPRLRPVRLCLVMGLVALVLLAAGAASAMRLV
jgi:hypothetical protein